MTHDRDVQFHDRQGRPITHDEARIFQTAVFDGNHKRVDIAAIPTATEGHAMQAHRTMVEEHSKSMVDPVIVDVFSSNG